MQLSLPPGPFDIVYADPPWDYKGREQFGFAGDVGQNTGGAVKQYDTMSTADICALPVPSILAKDALLFMWCTGPHLLTEAPKVLAAWGFDYATIAFVWDKERTNPGYYTLSQAEFVVVAKQNRIPQPRGARNERQWVTETIHEERGKHSDKPAEVRDRITRMFPTQRKLEMFARDAAPGWIVWGDQAPQTAASAAPTAATDLRASLRAAFSRLEK